MLHIHCFPFNTVTLGGVFNHWPAALCFRAIINRAWLGWRAHKNISHFTWQRLYRVCGHLLSPYFKQRQTFGHAAAGGERLLPLRYAVLLPYPAAYRMLPYHRICRAYYRILWYESTGIFKQRFYRMKMTVHQRTHLYIKPRNIRYTSLVKCHSAKMVSFTPAKKTGVCHDRASFIFLSHRKTRIHIRYLWGYMYLRRYVAICLH